MRLPLGLFVAAAFIATMQSANAAYQVLALVASNEIVPLRCQNGDCAAQFSAFCLQPSRGSPPRGVEYHAVGGEGITIVATAADGREINIDGRDHLQITALRSHVAVRISLPIEKLDEFGATEVAVRVGGNVSLVPEPIIGDPDPHTPDEIATATGPLRAIATLLADGHRDEVIAARMSNDLINRLPDRGRVVPGLRDTVWDHVSKVWANRPSTEAAQERARAAFERCRDTPLGHYFTMRQCMGSMHDNLMGDVNNAYWDALKAGT